MLLSLSFARKMEVRVGAEMEARMKKVKETSWSMIASNTNFIWLEVVKD